MRCIYKGCRVNEARTIRSDIDKAIGLTVPFAMLQRCTAKQREEFLLQWMSKRDERGHENKGYDSVNFIHQSCWDIVCLGETKTSKTEVKIINEVATTMEKYDDVSTITDTIKDKIIPLLLASKSTLAFTGAGLSVSAGLYTYRGAGGIDTLEEFAIKEGSSSSSNTNIEEEKEEKKE